MPSNLTQSDYDMLARSFITSDIADAAEIFRVDSATGAEMMGRKPHRDSDYNGLIFPYKWPGEDHHQPREYRLRRDLPEIEITPEGEPKEKNKYISPPGRGNLIYLPPNIHPAWLSNADVPIALTEGEKKTLGLHSLFVHEHMPALAIGIPGVWNWRGKIGKETDEQGHQRTVIGVIPDIERINWKRRKVQIIFDTNVATNESIKAARRELTKELQRRGARVEHINLPTDIPGVNGIDDLLWLKGAIFGLEILNATSDETPHLLYTWEEIEKMELEIGEQVIHELERGEIGLLAAVTNVGKSTLLRNIAVSLACGRPFLPVVKGGPPHRVLLIDFETRMARLQRDIKQMTKHLNQIEVETVRHNLAVMCSAAINDVPLSLNNPDHLQWVRMMAGAFKAELIIVDTVAAAFSIHDENSNAEVNAQILKPMMQLARDTDAAILLSHHIGKPRLEEGKAAEDAYRARGASSFGAFAAIVINLMQDPREPDKKVLSLAKSKGAQFDDAVLLLDQESRWFVKTDQAASATPTSYDLVLTLFKDGQPRSKAEICAALVGQVSERAIKYALSDAVKNRKLSCPKRGHYQLVEEKEDLPF